MPQNPSDFYFTGFIELAWFSLSACLGGWGLWSIQQVSISLGAVITGLSRLRLQCSDIIVLHTTISSSRGAIYAIRIYMYHWTTERTNIMNILFAFWSLPPANLQIEAILYIYAVNEGIWYKLSVCWVANISPRWCKPGTFHTVIRRADLSQMLPFPNPRSSNKCQYCYSTATIWTVVRARNSQWGHVALQIYSALWQLRRETQGKSTLLYMLFWQGHGHKYTAGTACCYFGMVSNDLTQQTSITYLPTTR